MSEKTTEVKKISRYNVYSKFGWWNCLFIVWKPSANKIASVSTKVKWNRKNGNRQTWSPMPYEYCCTFWQLGAPLCFSTTLLTKCFEWFWSNFGISGVKMDHTLCSYSTKISFPCIKVISSCLESQTE